MGISTPVSLVATGAMELPNTATLTTRRSVLVENCGPNNIWVSYDSNNLTVGYGHKIAPGTAREFPSDVLYGIAETADQTGVANDVTIVSEVT